MVIRAYAWFLILAPEMPIAKMAAFLGLIPAGAPLYPNAFAVYLGMVSMFLPFVTLPLYASVERIDWALVEAAQDLYASPLRGFLKVTWPLSMPGVVAGTLLTFIPAVGDYINAQLLGNTETRMLGNVIENLFITVGDYPAAAALSMVLMMLIVGMVLFYVRKSGTEEIL